MVLRAGQPIKAAGVVSRPDRKEALELASQIIDFFRERGLRAVPEHAVASFRKRPEEGSSLAQMAVDLIVTVGGDGTILWTFRELGGREIPVLGINMGMKGFLAEADPGGAFQAIERCIEGNYLIEESLKLSPTLRNFKLPDALNEVLLITRPPMKMLHLEVKVDAHRSLTCFSDGLLISTPIGSTAHSLSAGGPALDPKVNAFVIVAICPLRPFYPIVVPSTSTISVRLIRPQSKASVVVDGAYVTDLTTDDMLTVTESRHRALFVRFNEDSFYRRVQERMSG